ncbi:MAG: electron transfer flavoprotein subunit beta [Microbacteriaceae bacterium]|nr:electron transfer flavoprotein subunit beta [Microbacteriaceae bacterium]
MKIIVLVKQVPDTWGDRKLDTTTGWQDRGASELVIDEIDERAIEVALSYKDGNKDAEVVVMTMGPASATDVLRKGLAMGADSAVHVLDEQLVGADVNWTSAVLGSAITRAGYDLVVAGNEATDGRGGVIAAAVAERLGVPHLTFLNTIDITSDSVKGQRGTENGTLEIHAALPAVISVTEASAEPRFPNFKGIMSAKKKPLETITVGDLGLELAGGRSVVLTTVARAARAAGTKIVDEGNAGVELADFLASNRLL